MQTSYVGNFRVGGDPEACIINENGTVHTFTESPTLSKRNKAVGLDHCGMVFELRPAPSYTVNGFLDNVQKALFSPALDHVRDKRWKAGAYYSYLNRNYGNKIEINMGGHVHIEVPYEAEPSYDSYGRRREGTIPAVDPAVHKARLSSYDQITQVFEELDFLPKEECKQRRDTGHGYGTFGNYHPVKDANTGQQRVEYRTPCSWLFHPKNAFLLLTALKLATVSPVTAMRNVQGKNNEERYAGLLKFYRNFQHIDNDALIAANRICRSANASNIDRLRADTSVDFKLNWKPKTTKGLKETNNNG